MDFEVFFDREKAGLFRALCLMTRNRFEAEELAGRVPSRVRAVGSRGDDGGPERLFVSDRHEYLPFLAPAVGALSAKRTIGLTRADYSIAMIDDQDAVVRTLQPLSARQRAAVVLIDLLGYSSEEAGGCWASAHRPCARTLSVPTGT